MGKTVEQIYQKKTQHEHILTRPDMYIGTIESLTDEIWVYDEADAIMKQRSCTWTPGLYKIFDEILVNAADNKVRDPSGQTLIKVWIDERSVRVYNNGEGIPIQKHREHDLWIPEMIFGHLLTSSNYDDNEAKVTGGRNGFGAKLTNVFSTRFEIETVHSRSRKKFYMKWTNNMLQHDEPLITSCDSPDYTMVTFYPDFKRFQVEKFSEDMMLLMRRRVYDIAGCTDKTLKCFLNGERIAVTNFPEYVALYPTMGEEVHKHSYARVNDRWELSVRVSNIGFQQVSFVNSIATTRGGTHVRYILDQIINKVIEQAKKRSKTEVKPHMIRPHIFLFLNCLIENPGFDSQTKETLNTVRTRFGSTCEIPSSMIDYILRSGIVERSVEMANSKLTKEMASKMKNADRRQILGIPKLDDANEAGGKYSYRCTLILTEGDSAKTLCTAGLAVKDRDYFGVFPLRGKPLNVRDASLKKVMQCEEIQSIIKIMGLDIRQKNIDVNTLRYGHLMIMSDQDHDGSHIKGLIINMIQYYWPNLLRAPGFMQQFITPIVKARRKSRGTGEGKAISFFSMRDYFDWKQSIGDSISNYEIRYYKGLGTSGAKEGREYFENIERHRLDFVEESPADSDRICMAFAKDRVEERKEWITRHKANENNTETIDYSVPRVTYGEFVDRELVLFSIADCERSIPSILDGFKPGQRKILFSCFKRNLTRSIKVVQLAGYVSEHSAYHHGEQSLVQSIVAMAQDFIGSNNVPLLFQDGQFGTRLQGGKDHAAGRYIFTRLTRLARYIFHPADDYVVQYRDDDGLSVEPFHYCPVIPMVLVNGTSGIGTGFSTNIPSYNPIDIIDNLKRLINGESVLPMQPWYFGFTGTIREKEKGKFTSHGKYEIRPDGIISITELPIGVWTQVYKKFLEDLREKEIVVQYREHNTDVTVDFDVFVHPEVLQLWREQDVVEDRLQLREYIHATNIIAFNYEGRLTKYPDAESLLMEFYPIRIDYYIKRKDYILGELRRTTSKLENMVHFVREVVNGQLVVTKRKKRDLLEELRRRQYTPFPPHQKKKVTATTIEQDDDTANTQQYMDSDLQFLEHGRDDAAVGGFSVTSTSATDLVGEDPPEVVRASRDYDYLLGMKLWSLTFEMIERLEAQLRRAKQETEAMEKRTPKELWLKDLETLRPQLIAYFSEREREIASIQRKKMEKKKPFDSRRLRVPILSDKARQGLQKEVSKLSAGRRAAQTDDVMNANEASKTRGRPPSSDKKPPLKKRRRKKKGSDDNESLFDSSSNPDSDDLDDSHDGGNIVGVGDSEETLAAMRAKASKTQQRRKAADKKTGEASSTQRKPCKPVGELTGKASAKGPTTVTVADDFNLNGFGLDALSTPASTHPPLPLPLSTPAPVNGHSKLEMDDEDDDLAVLGLVPQGRGRGRGRGGASAAPATRLVKPRGRAATKRRRADSDEDSLSASSSEESASTGPATSESSSLTSSEASDEDFSD